MRKEKKEYSIKIQNPQIGELKIVEDLKEEFNFEYEEYWQSKKDPDHRVKSDPTRYRGAAEDYIHTCEIIMSNLSTLNFIEHILRTLIKRRNELQKIYSI